MKRIGNLFEKIIDINNLVRAHNNARRRKTNYKEVKMVDSDILGYCTKIQKMLVDKTYTTSKYKTFKIIDRGKERDICELPYYPDRIIQWAALQVIEDIFCKHFIGQTYAAIPKKGTHAALKKVQTFMEDKAGAAYCLKLDVKKFFPNINKGILKTLLRRKIKCRDTLWLLDDVVDSYDNGIPIGNYTSQYFGNFYLSFFDHWLKEEKHVKYYLRYMDDIVILHDSKEYLHQLRSEIDAYLAEQLGLTIKENWQVFPTFTRGIDFVGYRCFGTYTLLRNSTKKRLKAAVKKLGRKVNRGKSLNRSDQSRIGSYYGILGWCDSFRLKEKTINKFLGGNYGNNKRHTVRAPACA
jgi:hypothetical protein